MPPRIDVIVRTRADAFRSELLFRALDSIRAQEGVHARPIVVVNGQDFDSATMAGLEQFPDILLHIEREASARVARVAGRRLVTAPYFAYLDDDDELIGGSLLGPMHWLEAHPGCDVMVTNGYFVKDGEPLTEFTHIADHVAYPVLSLLDESWLQPGAFVCRTGAVPSEMLASDWNNLEWTHLAFELCAEGKRLHFMDVPTVYYSDTPGSMSKETQQDEAAVDLLRLVRNDTRLGVEVRSAAYEKYLRLLHDLAWRYWKQGQYRLAWQCHLASLRSPQTFRYLLFSRKLLWPGSVSLRRELRSR